MKLVYRGGATTGVVVPGAGIHALPGEPVDVPDDVAETLLAQSVWEKTPTRPRKGRTTRNEEG